MLPWACVCVEWCWEHDRAQELCTACKQRRQEMAAKTAEQRELQKELNACMFSWWEAFMKFFTWH